MTLDGGVFSSEDHEVTSITSTVTDSTSVASMESGHLTYAALEGSATSYPANTADQKQDANSLHDRCKLTIQFRVLLKDITCLFYRNS